MLTYIGAATTVVLALLTAVTTVGQLTRRARLRASLVHDLAIAEKLPEGAARAALFEDIERSALTLVRQRPGTGFVPAWAAALSISGTALISGYAVFLVLSGEPTTLGFQAGLVAAAVAWGVIAGWVLPALVRAVRS